MIGFQPLNFIANLKYMGVGLLCIFIVIGVIIASTLLINYLFSDKVGNKIDAVFDRMIFGKKDKE